MTILFFVFLFLVLLHFVYESILAPTFRFELRNSLFEQRDKLRYYFAVNKGTLSEEDFTLIDMRINTVIHHLSLFNIAVLVDEALQMGKNKDLQTQMHLLMEKIESINLSEIKEINKTVSRLSVAAVIINSFPILFYLFPLIILSLLLSWVSGIQNKIKIWADRLSYTPENRLQEMGYISAL